MLFLDFLDLGPGWDVAFASDFTEFTFYRIEGLILSDIRKYWCLAPPNLLTPLVASPLVGKTLKF